jgi:hypothetical protein
MNSLPKLKISAKKTKTNQSRICQGDIFSNIEILESFEVKGSKIIVQKLFFPYIVCLNQECDLKNDFDTVQGELKDSRLLHLAIAPAFVFEKFLNGSHWGEIFNTNNSSNRKDTKAKLIVDNEIPRFHYLKFPEQEMPELIIDFKHFFTVNREFLYKNIGNRICSLDDLFKEKISQRFSYFFSRIGLPELEDK